MEENIFKIGDIAVVICPESFYYLQECEILSNLKFTQYYRTHDNKLIDTNCYTYDVRMLCDGAVGGLRSFDLRPLRDDHRDVKSWDDCVWKPNRKCNNEE